MRDGSGGKRLALVCLLGSLLLTACDDGQSTEETAAAPPPPGVVVAPVGKAPLTEQASFTGRIQATSKVEIIPRIEGFLERRAFTEGAVVAEGDVLFEIERDSYEAAVKSAQGSLQRAEAAAKLADLEVQRQTTLVRSQSAAQARLDEATAKKGDADGSVLQAQAALTQAQLNLGYTTITAPIAGRISQAALDPGALVTPASGALATIVAVDPVYAVFPVSNRQLLQIRKEMEAHKIDASGLVAGLILADGSDYPHPGKIDFVNVTAEQGTDTVTVRAVFPNPEHFLVDGQIAKVTVRSGTPEQVLVVAQGAVLADQQGPYVLTVAADDTAEMRRVQLGASVGASVAVTSGLAEGDQVIVDGVQKVRPGQKVAPTQAAATAQP
ncbi:MAG TPA: efflux RND transporter periplasmic adaptor subunit [Geminicoccus sp.]|uniref:efflux RND transporter periplasmic adaptor subunit n=1 Tax=Geminicoccus sp. TaxID=2024832 RepID=UPI002BF70489|nr:efflux RND transporter periplasmic adaptor subunit [Geminicoccus sp.]HWL71094.1 efflux RND transporter periplasmic adaptor subunit [Geminicoccus sp.]